VLEAIEGDDPALDADLLSQSSPPPITALSGSNDWDYGIATGPDPTFPVKWRWNPLRDATEGGMGRLRKAVHARVAPFMGFCGGAQILALLEAKPKDDTTREEDQQVIDSVVRRTTGRPIRELAPKEDVEIAWPGDSRPRVAVTFDAKDPLFRDLADAEGPEDMWRKTTRAFPESHVDVIRPDAFMESGVLSRFEIVAHSEFCAKDVVSAGPNDQATPNPKGAGMCNFVTEAFRSKDGEGFPIVGTQFHPEQRDFPAPAPGDPPESVADPRLLVAAAYERIVDAYLAGD
jgi:hypothetical protein